MDNVCPIWRLTAGILFDSHFATALHSCTSRFPLVLCISKIVSKERRGAGSMGYAVSQRYASERVGIGFGCVNRIYILLFDWNVLTENI